MDDPNPRRREAASSKEASDQTRRCSSWEDQCIHEAEVDSSSESSYSAEQREVEQKLWLSFQNTASAIAQLYKDRSQGDEELWITFQNAAEIATNLYRESIDGTRSVSELALQCGYHRRNKELISWAKKRRRHIRREDLIGYLCGRSPPHRMSRSPSLTRGSDSPDNRLQAFQEAASMSGLNGAMADISFGGDTTLRRTNSPARNCQQGCRPDLPVFLSDEVMRRSDAGSSSRKRPSSHDRKPSSPKRRR